MYLENKLRTTTLTRIEDNATDSNIGSMVRQNHTTEERPEYKQHKKRNYKDDEENESLHGRYNQVQPVRVATNYDENNQYSVKRPRTAV